MVASQQKSRQFAAKSGLFLYRLLRLLLWCVLLLAAIRSSKAKTLLRQQVQWKQHLPPVLQDDKSLIWFHAPSVGELLLGVPIMQKVVAAGARCAVMVVSPSASEWLRKHPNTLPSGTLVLPFMLDRQMPTKTLLKKYLPSALVWLRGEVWPNTLGLANQAGIPQYVMAGILPARSLRWRMGWARSCFGSWYDLLDACLMVDTHHADRMKQLCPQLMVEVAGDTRYESALVRYDQIAPPELTPEWAAAQVLVVGSAWPDDHQCLLPAVHQALRQHAHFRVIWAPHEPSKAYVDSLLALFSEVEVCLFSQAYTQPSQLAWARVLVVDQVGVLSSLYSHGQVGYVGGGFHHGLHNVLEPAASGLNVWIGPHTDRSHEAEALVEEGLATVFSNSHELSTALVAWLNASQLNFTQQEARTAPNAQPKKWFNPATRAFVEARSGASASCFAVLSRHL